MDQICFAFKIYKFSTIEEAVSIMMKDPEQKLYQHSFYNLNGVCAICSGRISEHVVNLDNTTFIKDEEVVLDVTDRKLISDRSQIMNKISGTNTVQKLNKIEIVLPKETLLDFDDPLICQICFAEKLNQDPITKLECNHNFCNNCIMKYLENRINNGNVENIKCPFPNCTKCFTEDDVKKVVSTEIWMKYKKFLLQKIKNQNPIKYINCSFPNCENVIEKKDPFGKQIFFECESKHKFCSMCHECEWHENGKCKKVNY